MSSSSWSRRMGWFLVLFSSCLPWLASAIMPTTEVDVFLSDAPPTLSIYTLFASGASFGTPLPMRHANDNEKDVQSWTLQASPSDNHDLCMEPSTSLTQQDAVLLVPRGTCTFEIKAYHAQQMGAKAVIVYGSLGSRYAINATTTEIVWPEALQDYDCDKGRAWIPKSALSFDPSPYNGAQNDPLLSGDTSQNICRQKSSNQLETCPSKACLLTGQTDDTSGDYEACCAWDLYIWLYSDTYFTQNTTMLNRVQIPAAYITWQEGQKLLRALETNARVQLTLYERWRPYYNPSSALIWLLAVFVAAMASYLSAQDYHTKRAQVSRDKARERDNQQDHRVASRPPAERMHQPEETLELNAWHALGFLVMSSTSLLVLFYFKIYGVVKLMYALGCSKAFSTILLTPLIGRLLRRFRVANPTLWNIQWEDIGEITLADCVAHVVGYTLGLTWLVMAFSYNHPETFTFFWVMQDVFGACMCILFLQVVKLNSIRVASILLIIAFFYDIFFVFVSPLIFSKSVMIDVATSGGPPPNPEWCEKYPDDPKDCGQRGNPLPMLFTIPRIADYQGGANLLGLGDIVVPGLLISFAARFDAAKSLLGVMGGGNGSISSYSCPQHKYCGSTCWNGGYFVPVVIAYGIGLLMANAAVYLMEMGQPALLYLVPCCLGMVVFIGWRRNELQELWNGPRAIRAADVICYGESHENHAPIPQGDDDGQDALAVPSATDDQTGADETRMGRLT